MIDGRRLSLICPSLKAARRAELLPGLNDALARYQIAEGVSPQAAFLAQFATESGESSIRAENLNYTSPPALAGDRAMA
jgi:predicted chitinase